MTETLKQRLDSGALVAIEDDKGKKLASTYREDPFYVMVGVTGKHKLEIVQTNDARLENHWEGFKQACINQKETLADAFMNQWVHQTKTIAVPTLANNIDPTVQVTKPTIIGYTSGRRYTFRDGSAIVAFGRGKSHQLRKEDPKWS